MKSPPRTDIEPTTAATPEPGTTESGATGNGQAAESGPTPIPTPTPTQQDIVAAICQVYDPEIPVNIYELGLIYRIDIDDAGKVAVEMTVTAPACPVADILPVEVAEKVRAVPGVTDVDVALVWEPPWNPEMMSEAARLELGMF